ncbi:MAG: hypothetical protein LAQ69_47450 [Acidobacteriia bacterium]|nr:hypothetical protein [Terriglobia bacterium]
MPKATEQFAILPTYLDQFTYEELKEMDRTLNLLLRAVEDRMEQMLFAQPAEVLCGRN